MTYSHTFIPRGGEAGGTGGAVGEARTSSFTSGDTRYGINTK